MNNCFNPDINIYIYNIAKSQRSNGQGGLTDIGNVRTNTFNRIAKQKFGDISISKTQEGIIKPTNYSFTQKYEQGPDNQFNFKFSNNKVDEDGCVYSSDILTTSSQQVGGTKGDIKLLYKFYKHHKTKLVNTIEFINNDINPYYTTERIQKIITLAKVVRDRIKSYYSIPNNIPLDHEQRLNGSIIYNLNVSTRDKLIIFGDFHGSFHSFFRIFIRLHIMGVIDFPNYMINDGYKIIFLGDILDRGLFSLEIIYILFKFILNNTTEGNLQNSKIIINRGNHEERNTYRKESFKHELDHKLKLKSGDFRGRFDMYLSYCPSAIILNYNCICNNNIRHKMFYPNSNVNLNCNKKYWLSHGGIPLDDNLIKLPTESFFFINSIRKIIKPSKGNKPAYTLDMNTIRWFDYIDSQNISCRGPITVEELLRFMRLNKIDFCIRGHTDNNENAFLLSTSSENSINPMKYKNTFPLNNKLIQQNNQGDKKVIFPSDVTYINNPMISTITQIPGFVAKIKTDEWYDFSSFNHTMHDSSVGNPSKYNLKRPRTFTNNNVTVYPVLTISTNSDSGRSLNNDSFIVFNFTNEPDFTYNFNSTILQNMNILASNTYSL